MIERPREQIEAGLRRLRRFERRELRELRRWIERTENLLHVSILVFVPLLIGVVTMLSNAFEGISFLLFPPLASGAYTLFADPEGAYASPWKFVAGLTAGAFAGWLALEASARFVYGVPPGQFEVQAASAALSVFLTGVVTWTLDLEVPAAFSAALLVLVTGTSQLSYVLGVALSSTIVAAGFVLWRGRFYERRARYLYETTTADDHVLVPMRGEQARTVATFGARIAAAHDAGKVVLLDLVEDEALREAEQAALRADGGGAEDEEPSLPDPAREAAARLERHAQRIRTQVGVPCEVVVARGDAGDGRAALRTAREKNCDLIATPYEERAGRLSPFVRGLFGGSIDVIALRTVEDRTSWDRVMVPVRKPGDVAHAMLDFARRLAGQSGSIAVCHCIADEGRRRRAETMLANLVETFDGPFETRVWKGDIESFLAENGGNYDLTIIGASTDRTAASRFVSRPTFERIHSLECDVAVVHRG